MRGDAAFWEDKWRRNEIGFHQATPHRWLPTHFSALGLAPGARVFVPLAGKSLDLVWLRDAGFAPVGVELSAIAVRAFFEEQRIAPRREPMGAVERWSGGGIELLRGDLFALTPELLGGFHGVFDRASFIALPDALRGPYVEHLAALSPSGARTLLVTLEYDPHAMDGPPYGVDAPEVRRRYGVAHDVALLARDEQVPDFPKFAARGLTRLAECAWRLTRR
jgi:thiopurine S-methyltransferase